MSIEREPPIVRLVRDLLRVVFFAIVVSSVLAIIFMAKPSEPLWLDWFFRVVGGLSAQLLCVAVLREILPKPKPGSYIVGVNSGYVRWVISSVFVEVMNNPLLRFPHWLLHTSRVFYLKAMGADIPWDVSFHQETAIREPSLLVVGKGSQIEPGVAIESVVHGAGRVRLSRVIIGRGCLVGAHSVLMPGVTVAHEARIEPGAFIGEGVKVGVGASIGDGVRIERGVDLGSYSRVGTGAIIAQGVRVGDRARIAPGSVVAPDTQIGEREVWEGTPARRVLVP